jgi:hypothetical protein
VYKRLTGFLLSAVIGLTACNRGHKFTAHEYDVVSGYVAASFASQNGLEKPVKIVILNMTSSGDDDYPTPWEKMVETLRQKSPSLQQTTIDGFRSANARQAFLVRGFRFPVEYEIVDESRLAPIFKRDGGGWDAYYKQYPGAQGIATLSRVGFSADGAQALFYIKNSCGGLCGSGWYLIMEKRDGRWMIVKAIQKWVS